MSTKQKATQIKLTVSPSEVSDLDKAVANGLGTCRADVCRKAMIVYLHDQAKEKVAA